MNQSIIVIAEHEGGRVRPVTYELVAFALKLKRSEAMPIKVIILGEEVATLVSARLSAGSYSYEWDALNLASGIYLYRLEAGGFVEIKKMILVR